MLAVTTFSLSIMVSAFAAASSAGSPRASELVTRDSTTQTAIASFISAFIFAIIAKVALGIGYYDEGSRLVMFAATAGVLIYLVVTLIRWVKALSTLGSFGNTLRKTEGVAFDSVRRHHATPFHVRVRPGALVTDSTVLAVVECPEAEIDGETLLNAVEIGTDRSFEYDPRHGLIVLSEIGQKALSPSINDPGSAIATLTALVRVLVDGRRGDREAAEYDLVTIVPLDDAELVVEPFRPLIRDGSGLLEVAIRIQSSLGAIANECDSPRIAEAAHRLAREALDRSERAMRPHEFAVLKERHARWHSHLLDGTRPIGA